MTFYWILLLLLLLLLLFLNVFDHFKICGLLGRTSKRKKMIKQIKLDACMSKSKTKLNIHLLHQLFFLNLKILMQLWHLTDFHSLYYVSCRG